MNRRTGLLLVVGLLVFSFGLMGLMKWMELRTQAAGAVGETALLAEAQRVLGASVRSVEAVADLTGDGAPEHIATLLDETGQIKALAIVTIARKKVKTLAQVSDLGIVGPEEKRLAEVEPAEGGYRYAIVTCPKALPVVELTLLDANGQPVSDPLYLRWNGDRKALEVSEGC